MGPRSGDRGNEDGRAGVGAPRGASMGPRSGDRGNAISENMGPSGITASMGPRSGDRGNEDLRRAGLSPAELLQWGRGQVTAEIIYQWSEWS